MDADSRTDRGWHDAFFRDEKMLVLSRKVTGKIFIGEVEIVVLSLTENNVRLGIIAPKEMKIIRGELLNAERSTQDVDSE